MINSFVYLGSSVLSRFKDQGVQAGTLDKNAFHRLRDGAQKLVKLLDICGRVCFCCIVPRIIRESGSGWNCRPFSPLFSDRLVAMPKECSWLVLISLAD